METTETKGHWEWILTTFGIDTKIFSGKHQSCPMCGGTDRFRYDNKWEMGDYICNQCGSGNGFSIIMGVHNITFAECMGQIKSLFGYSDDRNPYEKPKLILHDGLAGKPKKDEIKPPEVSIEDVKRKAKALSAVNSLALPIEGSPVIDYLCNRGLTIKSISKVEGLRFCRSLDYWDNGRMVGKLNCMVGLMTNGEPVSYHRTFLHNDKRVARKIMPPIRPMAGSSIRLFKHEDELGIAEGIETAMACYELFDVPTWSVINTNGMKSFVVPDGVTKLTIFADNDANFAGQSAAYTLANKLTLSSPKVSIVVHVPEKENTDWLDVLYGVTYGSV